MAEKEFYVKAIDQDGVVLVDETIATLRNGFFELWLPRNRKVELRLQGLNRTTRGIIETFGDSNTCITTFQLR